MEKETIYIDPVSFYAQRRPDDSMIACDTSVFIGKCDEFVEGYIFVPDGYEVQIGDSVYPGELLTPWKNYDELDSIQRQYEREQLADMKAALELLGVTVDG